MKYSYSPMFTCNTHVPISYGSSQFSHTSSMMARFALGDTTLCSLTTTVPLSVVDNFLTTLSHIYPWGFKWTTGGEMCITSVDMFTTYLASRVRPSTTTGTVVSHSTTRVQTDDPIRTTRTSRPCVVSLSPSSGRLI